MKRNSSLTLLASAFSLFLSLFPNQSVFAANGTALYFTVVDPSGTGYDQDGDYWATSETGTPGVWVSADQMTFGTSAGDLNYPVGSTFSVTLDSGNDLNGLFVNTTNATITFPASTSNTHLDSAEIWWITNGSTIIDQDTRQQFDANATIKGINWNNEPVLFEGGGTVTFQTPMGCNSTGVNTNNGVIINFEMSSIATPGTDAGTYTGGFRQNAGTLNFASAGSAYQFYGFTAGKLFTINGGTIDNTSGSAITLNWTGGGGISIGGNFAFTGSTASLDLGTAPVTLAQTPTITITNNTLEMDGIISGAFGLTLNGPGTLLLAGASTYTGGTTVGAGTLALTGTGSISHSTPLVVTSATLDMSGLTAPYLTNSVVALTNTTIVISAPETVTTNVATVNLDLGGTTNIVNVASLPAIFSYPTVYHVFRYTTLSGANNIGLGTLPFSSTPFVGYITNENNFEDLVIVSGPPPARQLTWTGTDPSNPDNWDIGVSLNWETNGVATSYNQSGGNENDFVTFDDTATGETNVSLTTTLTPGGLTINNNTHIYNLGNSGSGGGSIGGTVTLTKKGSGLAILDDGGNNSFTGGITISAGTLQVGNGDGLGSLGSGSVADNSSLVFNDSYNDANGIANNISGTGTLTHQGGDILKLSGNNTLAGPINVVSNTVINQPSTLQLGSATALGSATTIVGANCELDLNGLTGTGIIKIGNSTIDNTSGTIPANNLGLTNVTLTANATIATTGNRWDLRSPGGDGGNPATASLSTGGQPFNLIKTGTGGGTGFWGLVSVGVDPKLANIDVQGGTLDFEGNTTGLGNPANTLTIEGTSTSAAAILELWNATNLLNKVIVINDGGELFNGSGNNTIVGPVAFTNSSGSSTPDCTIDLASGTTLTLSGQITGNAIMNLDAGTGTLALSGNDANFAGGVSITSGTLSILTNSILTNGLGVTMNGGALNVTGALIGGGVTNTATTATVSGFGGISNTLDTTGFVSPGTGTTVGTLTVGGLVLEGGAQLNVSLNFGNAIGSGSNDLLAVNGNLTANGNTINVAPLGILQDGVPYTVMTYTGTLNTNNAPFSVNGVDGYNFVADTSIPGKVNIIASGGPPVWNGGSATDNNWSDSTNWGGVAVNGGDSLFFAGVNRLTTTNDTSPGTTYDNIEFVPGAGSFVLNGNPIALQGTNVLNLSTSTQTVNLGVDYSSVQTFNGGTGSLVLSGGLTNTASGVVIATFSGTGSLVDLLGTTQPTGTNVLAITGTNANWTLLDNPSSTPISLPCPLEITNGTFTFGTATSSPNLTNTSPNGAPQDVQVGYLSGTTATLNFSNGIYTTAERINTGLSAGATGVVNVVNGTVNIGSQFQGANGAQGISFFNVTGGTVNIGTAALPTSEFFVASRGTGTLNMNGGALNCGTLDVSRGVGPTNSTGTVNLNGGTLTSSGVIDDATLANSIAVFNFNGGTLQASTNNATFFQSGTVAITTSVDSGGAIVNDGGWTITINQLLQHGGSGTDGGLIKNGAGTLTLGAANTYNGNTTINAGTLALTNTASLGTGNIIMSGTATFSVSELTSTYGLASGQTLTVTAPGATLSGSANTGSGVLSLAYAGSAASLTVSNGTLTLASTTRLTINNTGAALAAGTYTIIANGPGGAVTGTVPSSFTVGGAGIAAGATASLQLSGGALNLIVAGSGPSTPPTIQRITMSAGNIIISGTNNSGPGGGYQVLTSTNLTVPPTSWTVLTNGTFDGNGNFSVTNSIGTTNARQFYILQVP